MKTRTAVLYSPGESIRVEEIELDPPKEHEVQVKIVAAGVCHSDYHLVSGELPGYMPMASPASNPVTMLSSASFPRVELATTAPGAIPISAIWEPLF